jgi:hypothetical protein
VALLREGVGLLGGVASLHALEETPECLDEAVTAAFVEGRLSADERPPVVTHLLKCSRCRAAVTAVGQLLADRTVKAGPVQRWGRWAAPVGAAAAAVLLFVMWPRAADDVAPVLRDSTEASTRTPQPIAPAGSVPLVDRFVWSSVAGAARYRLRLYDAEGSVLWSTEAADTSVAFPDSVSFATGRKYFWKVEARTEGRRWTTSALAGFQVTGPHP